MEQLLNRSWRSEEATVPHHDHEQLDLPGDHPAPLHKSHSLPPGVCQRRMSFIYYALNLYPLVSARGDCSSFSTPWCLPEENVLHSLCSQSLPPGVCHGRLSLILYPLVSARGECLTFSFQDLSQFIYSQPSCIL